MCIALDQVNNLILLLSYQGDDKCTKSHSVVVVVVVVVVIVVVVAVAVC